MLCASARATCIRLPAARPRRSRTAVMGGAQASSAPEGLSDGCKGAPAAPGAKLPLMADESLMRQKAHGTCETPVKPNVRWGCDVKLADRLCWCVRAR